MFTKAFWLATLERCVRTFFATLVGLGLGDATDTVGSAMNLSDKVQASAWATLLTFAICLGASKVGTVGPSFGTEVTTPPAPPIKDDRAAASLITVIVGVVIGIFLIWLVLVLVGHHDNNGIHGNDWERVAPVRTL